MKDGREGGREEVCGWVGVDEWEWMNGNGKGKDCVGGGWGILVWWF